MKQFRSLFILLIGMISLTSLAATPTMEQKPEATIVKVTTLNDVVIVAFDGNDFVQSFYLFNEALQALNVSFKEFSSTNYAVINDVGWSLSYMQPTRTIYKEKLQKNFNLHFKDKLLFTDTLVRDKC